MSELNCIIIVKEKILLNYSDSTSEVESEERTRFLFSILERMEIPVDSIWNGELNLTVGQKIKLREILSTYNIMILEDLDNHMQMFVEGELVAEWHPCTFKLKKDLREINPKKKLYIEMETNY